ALLPIVAPQGIRAVDATTNGVLILIPIGLAMTYGLVCGAMLLAGEDEGGTQVFLDTLPALRRQVWASKLLPGVLLTLCQGLALAAVAAALDLQLGEPSSPEAALTRFDWFWLLPALCVEGLAWGLLGSAVSRN